MSTQILHLDGRRELAETQVTIQGSSSQDCTWSIKVLDDGTLYCYKLGGGSFIIEA